MSFAKIMFLEMLIRKLKMQSEHRNVGKSKKKSVLTLGHICLLCLNCCVISLCVQATL